MTSHSNKWSFVCFGVILMGVSSWKHFYDLLQWSHEMSSSYFVRQKQGYREDVQIWQLEANCGLRQKCPDNSFSLFLSTGTPSDKKPKLCVAGKYVIKPLENEEGRGLNAAVVESNSFKVVSVRNFDTYLYNKTADIAEWIDGLLDNDILIIFTSDEASAKLSGETKSLFNQLGSGKIQNIQYRSQWYMITQKANPGFTTYEKMTYSKKKNWGETIEIRGCIPRKIPKKTTTADEPLKENRKKMQFCEGKVEERYKGFCSEPRFEMIMPALLTNKSLVGNLAYTLPIFVYASEDLEVLISCLDSLIHQPGVVTSLITVLYENDMDDVPNLTKIFGMHSNKTNFAKTFEEKLKQSKEICQKIYPRKKYLIVLDSGVIPAPDFLFFVAQTLPILERDNGVSIINGWSCNCYGHNGSVHLAYRITGTPKFGAVVSAGSDVDDFYGEMFAPDVARVQGMEACHLPSLEPNNWIERPQDLSRDRYFHKMVMLQQISQIVDLEELLTSCSHSAVKNETNILYLPKNNSLSRVLQCLGVMKNEYGMYDGTVRLFVEGKNVLIITSESSLYKSRPIVSICDILTVIFRKISDKVLNSNCGMALSIDQPKTSTQISFPYSPAMTVLYEKQPLPRIPAIKTNASFKIGSIYTPFEGYKSTYGETYKTAITDDNLDIINTKMIKKVKEYSKLGRSAVPLSVGMTEYGEEYNIKQLPPSAKGASVEQSTTCPMVVTGRDERDPLPLTSNYYKYLDIYVSTTRSTHRPFTLQEQRTIAAKDIVTSQETMDIPKGRGFGCKFPAFPGQDLDKRDKHMTDKVMFSSEHRARYLPRGMPKVPNFGCESETQGQYQPPSGVALPHIFDRFIEFNQTIAEPTAKQTLCPPGMYTTETYAINKHTSPQTVV